MTRMLSQQLTAGASQSSLPSTSTPCPLTDSENGGVPGADARLRRARPPRIQGCNHSCSTVGLQVCGQAAGRGVV